MSVRIPLFVRSTGVRRREEPVAFGLPLPLGMCQSTDRLSLVDSTGRRVPSQASIRDRWPDGSARWVWIVSLVTTAGGDPGLALEVREPTPPPPDASAVTTLCQPHRIVVNTGAAEFTLVRRGSHWLDQIAIGSRVRFGSDVVRLMAIDDGGALLTTAVDTVEVEDAGPVRSTVRVDGRLLQTSRSVLNWRLRLSFHAGQTSVLHELTVHNPTRAQHPGGFWELGDPGSARLKSLAVEINFPKTVGKAITCWPEQGVSPVQCEKLVLSQESSGLDRWASSNHITADGTVPLRFRGYSLTADDLTQSGRHASPVVTVEHDDFSLGVSTQHFWENFPQAIEADSTAGRLVLGLFPRQSAVAHELQGGEQKTHAFCVAFSRDLVADVPLDWCREPTNVRAAPDWYCSSEAVRYLTPASDDSNSGYLSLVQSAVEGEHSFLRKRDLIDEYGWRNFGEIYGDHEAVRRSSDEPPLVSHYNNQYDGIGGFAVQFLRTGDWRWWDQMDQLARHVADIDIYRTTEDKAGFNGGLFWHTDHYQDAGRATHRSFPKSPGVSGGGPSPDHVYSAGLLLHYFLTGSLQSRDAVLLLAGWILALDDGRLTPFRWLAAGPTGLPTMAGKYMEQGPGRAGGNSISTLIDAYHLSGDRLFLDKCDEYLRRCVHPQDDVAARDLLDAENRWYYTVFFQAVGKYLDLKALAGELDASYSYARSSLLTYARWMAAHEVPYLSRPERLQYPTETWAAQDMRKAEVFLLASLHAGPTDRTMFRERAGYFFDYSIRTLSGMATRTLARPVVLLLSNGYRYAWFQLNLAAALPEPLVPDLSPRSRRIEPQRVRAMRRAKYLAVGVILGAAILLSAILLS